MKKEKNDGVSAGKVVAVGAGVVALATASYFFFGPEGKKNRNSLKGWMVKMKGEIIEKIEGVEDLTEDLYNKIVDTVAAKYVKAGKIGEMELRMFSDMLKTQWKGIVKTHNKSAGTTTKTTVKKAVKTVAKKAATKKKA